MVCRSPASLLSLCGAQHELLVFPAVLTFSRLPGSGRGVVTTNIDLNKLGLDPSQGSHSRPAAFPQNLPLGQSIWHSTLTRTGLLTSISSRWRSCRPRRSTCPSQDWLHSECRLMQNKRNFGLRVVGIVQWNDSGARMSDRGYLSPLFILITWALVGTQKSEGALQLNVI